MRKQQEGVYYSKVYTDRPAYADFEPMQKFQAIQQIVRMHLKDHPNAICSYSGGADSDIMKAFLREIMIDVHTADFIKKYGSEQYYRLAGLPPKQPTHNNLYELNLTDCLEV